MLPQPNTIIPTVMAILARNSRRCKIYSFLAAVRCCRFGTLRGTCRRLVATYPSCQHVHPPSQDSLHVGHDGKHQNRHTRTHEIPVWIVVTTAHTTKTPAAAASSSVSSSAAAPRPRVVFSCVAPCDRIVVDELLRRRRGDAKRAAVTARIDVSRMVPQLSTNT